MAQLAHRVSSRGASILFLYVALLAYPWAARAQEVIRGLDLWETPPGSASYDTSPIPPGFFDPGSQVIIGGPIIQLKGIPLEGSTHPAGSDLGPTDTMIQRLNNTSGLDSGPVMIPIEIVALHLMSVQPFTVIYSSSPPEQWNLEVFVQPAAPGQMNIQKSHPNGGTFTSTLPVQPHLIFTRIGDNAMRIFDDSDTLQQLNPLPWSYTPSPDAWQSSYSVGGYAQSNFWPGVNPAFPAAPLQNIFYDGARLDLSPHLATPEPGSLALIGLAALALRRRSRR